MNSFERTRASLKFSCPDKVPVFKGAKGDIIAGFSVPSKNWNPGWKETEKGLFPHFYSQLMNWDEPDWVRTDPKFKDGNWVKFFPRQEIDEWGRYWNMSIKGDIGHPGKPSLPDWINLEEYLGNNTPDMDEVSRYEISKQIISNYGKNKYVIFNLGLGPLDIGAGIRGFSNFLIDHKRHPIELQKLLTHLTDYFIKYMKCTFKHGLNPHGFFLLDDLGEQHGPFFSKKTFEKFYEPVYRPIIEEAHLLGCELILHCCGKVDKLIPSFINWGLDAIEFDSPRMSGYQDLSPFRGKISIWGCVNIQSIYPYGTPEECEREVWHMIRNLGTKNGGFTAYYYPQPNVIRVPPENITAYDEGLKNYGDYSKINPKWWKTPVPLNWKNRIEQDIVPPLPI